MKIRFNGIIEERSGGCKACGRKGSKRVFVTSKMYILPSGRSIDFMIGRQYEVSERDASFLLNYRYMTADGEVRHVFEVQDG